jgi:hypothetical protein
MSARDFGDPQQILHIPARDLTGTREAKLAQLDNFLFQLQVVRLVLGGRAVRLEGLVGAPSAPRTDRRSVDWTWPMRNVRSALNDLKVNARLARPIKERVRHGLMGPDG